MNSAFVSNNFPVPQPRQQLRRCLHCQASSKPAPGPRAPQEQPAMQQLGQGAPRPRTVKRQPDIKYLDVELPPATHTRVRTAKFISSSVGLPGCPPEKYPEFAVIGRSNVGKSSLINQLTDVPGLAKTSKEPGMTKCINHFLINDSWYLVDLPGYGYAKSSKTKRMEWLDFTKDYCLNRGTLANILLLVDASIAPQGVDLECADWLGSSEVPFTIVFTKMDKSKECGANLLAFKKEMMREWEALPPCFETSSVTGVGKVQLLQHLAGLRQLYLQEN